MDVIGIEADAYYPEHNCIKGLNLYRQAHDVSYLMFHLPHSYVVLGHLVPESRNEPLDSDPSMLRVSFR
jgi:hypothetical protein